MFVLLSATTASRAGIPGADELRTDAERVVTEYFWDESEGMCIDGWSGDWATARTYRGLNACMHGVEAMLAAGGSWTQRAARVCTRVAEFAGAFGWRLPEHFEVDWTPLPQAHRDNPADPFKPYGATVGHGLEWSRLLVCLESVSPDPEGRLLATARHLYQRAVADGWEVDGAPGFVYTTDWSGQAIVHERMHWVLAEAVSAAATLRVRTGEQQYHDDELGWWAYADRHVLDRALGSWHHELDRENRPASSVWPGKPDLYHAVQATLIPRLPLGGSVAAAVQGGLGRTARP
jgi:mannose/cellobiose epimerase-like protein (N-acyl-D-glucosamine 2-epimerase family)